MRKKLLLLVLLSAALVLLYRHIPSPGIKPIFEHISTDKQKILILTSRSGGGHISASYALKDYLQEKYTLKAVTFLQAIMGYIDPIQLATFKKRDSDDIYNYLLQKRWIKFINCMTIPSILYVTLVKPLIKKYVYAYIEQEKPALVISVIPIFNDILLSVCQKLSLPFLILTVDLDTHIYTLGIKKPTYSKFMYTLPFDQPEIRKKIYSASIEEKNITISGFPVRKSFLEHNKNKHHLKQEFTVAKNKPVILILMGANGSNTLYTYLEYISKLSIPAHVIICLGRNEQLRAKLEKYTLPAHITTTIVSFTNRIADLMTISNLLITKSGPTSICEALYQNLPIIIDKTGPVLHWEELNAIFVQKHNFGIALTDYKQLPQLLEHYLEPKKQAHLCKNLLNFNKPNPALIVPNIIDNLLAY